MYQQDKIHTGYTNFNVGMFFFVPDSFEKFHHIEDGKKIARVSTSCWYTNMPVAKHKEDLVLYKHYTPEEYPEYDNYKAINVNTYTDIHCDYDGVIGVPITFLDKYNPEQFEIGILKTWDRYDAPVLKGQGLYTHILIRRKKIETHENRITQDYGSRTHRRLRGQSGSRRESIRRQIGCAPAVSA